MKALNLMTIHGLFVRMEDITKQSKSRLRKKFLLTILFIIILAIISYILRNIIGINFHLYAVSAGPFFEEAFKGGTVLLFFLILLLSNEQMASKLDSKKNWFIAGSLIGLFIGLYEAFIEYSSGLHRIIPTFNHIFWSAIVCTGIWIAMKSEREWKLLKLTIPYTLASISHIFWNYHSYLEGIKNSELAFGLMTWILILTAIIFVLKIERYGSFEILF